jgi:hypothetical protein
VKIWSEETNALNDIDKGLSVILIERGEGVETTPIKTSYSAAAGTTL